MELIDIAMLKKRLSGFAEERGWEKFHSPKNLAMALSVEVAELVEIFQWLTEKEASELDENKRDSVGEELADIILYSTRLADLLDINLQNAIESKYKKNEKKYPPEKCFGKSTKYNRLEDSE